MMIKIFCTLFLIFFSVNNCFAIEQINKNLSLKTDYPYLLSFDEKISSYKLSNSNAVNVELLTNIFNEKKEILIKPLKIANTNLLVWTDKGLYNFSICVNSDIITKNETAPNLIGFELDKPPHISNSYDNSFDLELDKPPGVR